MVGRLDDWLKIVADKRSITVDPGVLEWGGVAVLKKAYGVFKQRGYHLRLLSAAFRNHMHWSEFIGGDVVISPPYKWQVRLNASEIEVVPRIDKPVAPEIIAALMKFEDFRRAYEADGLSIADFDSFPPTRRTLRQFIAGCHDLDAQVREFMLPDPDKA
jgi:transaldolase